MARFEEQSNCVIIAICCTHNKVRYTQRTFFIYVPQSCGGERKRAAEENMSQNNTIRKNAGRQGLKTLQMCASTYSRPADLLTPVGLRSLSSDDPRYVGIYIGSPLERDGGYHQGTVWGWLIGHFVDAYRKVHSKDAKADRRVNQIIAGFADQMTQAMTGQISEIFDGDPPHAARGCAAQAWSVAEVLRICSTTDRNG